VTVLFLQNFVRIRIAKQNKKTFESAAMNGKLVILTFALFLVIVGQLPFSEAAVSIYYSFFLN